MSSRAIVVQSSTVVTWLIVPAIYICKVVTAQNLLTHEASKADVAFFLAWMTRYSVLVEHY